MSARPRPLRALRREAIALLLVLALLAGCTMVPAASTSVPSTPAAPTEVPPDDEPEPTATVAIPTVVMTTTASPTITATTVAAPTTATTSVAPVGATPPAVAGSPSPSTIVGSAVGPAPGPPPPPPPTRVTDANDPSNGPLAKSRLVTYYGHPFSDRMGILGEYEPEVMMAKLKDQAAAYTVLDPSRPAIPTIELIASVAQDVPGRDGLYLQRTPKDTIEEYAQLAEKHGALLLLDIQIGRDTVANEVQVLLPFLKRPYVHLAIDPEFAVKPGQIPGEDYGSVDASDISGAGKVLGEVVRQSGITDKVLLVHQFLPSMITNKNQLGPMANVQLVINTDGFGVPPVKVESYEILVRNEPIQYGGIKLFYRQDDPLMTPEEILALDPSPVVVIYQ